MKQQQQDYIDVLAHVDETARETLQEASWNLMMLLTQYHPRHSNLPVHLYKANDIDDIHSTNDDMPDNGWQNYTTQDLITYLITGDHVSMHFEQGLLQICEHFNQHLI